MNSLTQRVLRRIHSAIGKLIDDTDSSRPLTKSEKDQVWSALKNNRMTSAELNLIKEAKPEATRVLEDLIKDLSQR